MKVITIPPNQTSPMTEAEYYVLLALKTPLHGYALMQAINEISRGRMNMGPGTLYGVLSRLEKEKLIRLSVDDGRRKVYCLREAGYLALKAEYRRITAMALDGMQILGEENGHEA